MQFIYKLRHKASGLFLSPTYDLSKAGIVWSEFPDFSLDNIMLGDRKTSYGEWEIVQFAIIIHEVHQPSLTHYYSRKDNNTPLNYPTKSY